MKVNESVNKNKKIEISGKDFLKGTDFINSVIHEYLLKKEYYKTLDTFQVTKIIIHFSLYYYKTVFY